MKGVGGRREGGSWIEGEGLGFMYNTYIHTYMNFHSREKRFRSLMNASLSPSLLSLSGSVKPHEIYLQHRGVKKN